MAVIRAYDRLGDGISVRAGNFSYYGTDSSYDGNAIFEEFDDDTVLVAATFENQTYGFAMLIDYIGYKYVFEIDSFVTTDNQLNPLYTVENVNIRFDVRDDFSGWVNYTNLLAANDRIYGNRYSDYLEAGKGHDLVNGNGGNDTILAGSGSDTIIGAAGNDVLRGGSGQDLIRGGVGQDRLFGEADADVFVFGANADSTASATSCDVIVDFSLRQDKISLAELDAFTPTATNNAFVWRGTGDFSSGTQGEVRYKKFDLAGQANDYTMIYIDNDRDTGAEMMIRLNGVHNLTAGNFVL